MSTLQDLKNEMTRSSIFCQVILHRYQKLSNFPPFLKDKFIFLKLLKIEGEKSKRGRGSQVKSAEKEKRNKYKEMTSDCLL